MRTFHKTIAALSLAAILLPTATFAQAQAAPQPLSPQQVLEYLAQNRRDSALVSYTATPDGRPDPSDPAVFHNADQPMPLASTIKIVILAAYAREVAAGRLDPAQTVAISDWERYYLPLTDGGAHPAALEHLGILSGEYGFAQDPTRTVSIDDLAAVMIRFSDNAATDWLLERLGPAAVRATIASAGLRGQQAPLPIVGVFLSWHNHEQGVLTRTRLSRLLRLRPKAYAAQVRRLAAAFQDPEWRQAEFRWMLETADDRDFRVEAQAGEALFPKGTARDYARIMAGVVTGTFLSEEVSRIMRRHLEWPMEIPQIREGFDAFGNKGGSLASVLTDAYFFVPKAGDFAGEPRVSVVFFRGVRPQAYESLATGMGIFCLTVGVDEELAVQVGRTLARPRR
jgi:D-alanyl-D-alanine carboxypeptidase